MPAFREPVAPGWSSKCGSPEERGNYKPVELRRVCLLFVANSGRAEERAVKLAQADGQEQELAEKTFSHLEQIEEALGRWVNYPDTQDLADLDEESDSDEDDCEEEDT